MTPNFQEQSAVGWEIKTQQALAGTSEQQEGVNVVALPLVEEQPGTLQEEPAEELGQVVPQFLRRNLTGLIDPAVFEKEQLDRGECDKISNIINEQHKAIKSAAMVIGALVDWLFDHQPSDMTKEAMEKFLRDNLHMAYPTASKYRTRYLVYKDSPEELELYGASIAYELSVFPDKETRLRLYEKAKGNQKRASFRDILRVKREEPPKGTSRKNSTEAHTRGLDKWAGTKAFGKKSQASWEKDVLVLELNAADQSEKVALLMKELLALLGEPASTT